MHMDRNRQRRVPLRPRNRTREPFPAKGRRRQQDYRKHPPNRARTGQYGLDSRRKSGILPVRLRRKNPDTHPRRQNGTEDLFGPKHLFHGPERHLHNPRRRQYLFVGGQSGKRHAALSRRRRNGSVPQPIHQSSRVRSVQQNVRLHLSGAVRNKSRRETIPQNRPAAQQQLRPRPAHPEKRRILGRHRIGPRNPRRQSPGSGIALRRPQKPLHIPRLFRLLFVSG